MNRMINVKNSKRKKLWVELETQRGLHYDRISKRVQGTWYTRYANVCHTQLLHTLQLNLEFFSTLSILLRKTSDIPRHSHSLYFQKK